jgi:hypothetical protein
MEFIGKSLRQVSGGGKTFPVKSTDFCLQILGISATWNSTRSPGRRQSARRITPKNQPQQGSVLIVVAQPSNLPTRHLRPIMHPAYFETHFIAADGPHDWPEQFAIITAYATTGDVWTDQQNEAADQALEGELRNTGRWVQRLTGYSPTSGHAEPGWAVKMPWDEACDVGLRFKQDAIYTVNGDELSVTLCDHRRGLVPVGGFRARVSRDICTAPPD